MTASRVPDFSDISLDGLSVWFGEMSARNLIFHPENEPREVVDIADGARTFDDVECAKLQRIMDAMYKHFGEQVLEAAYPNFMKKAGFTRALDS